MRNRLRIIVIADDITGAAEMAGIAHSYGLQVKLTIVGNASKRCSPVVGDASKRCSPVVGDASKRCSPVVGDASKRCSSEDTTNVDVLVIATDTRSMTEAEAVEETRLVVSHLTRQSSIFKKTDSALRGHVIAELKALMNATDYQRAVYLPANPSKGRIIKAGVYYLKEKRGESKEETLVPLHTTAFSYDPEFPAHTSVLRKRFPDAAEKGIIMPDAETADDIRTTVANYNDGRTLFAGAADLFQEFLLTVKKKKSGSGLGSGSSLRLGLEKHHLLILCGSTQSKPRELGFPESPMPLSVYNGSDDLRSWLDDALPKYQREGALMLTIPHTHRTGRATAIHLRTVMAAMARQIAASPPPPAKRAPVGSPDGPVPPPQGLPSVHPTGPPLHLVIEGGATARAAFQAFGWTHFDILQELAPGVVQMRATDGTVVTLKPGSYPWGNVFKSLVGHASKRDTPEEQ